MAVSNNFPHVRAQWRFTNDNRENLRDRQEEETFFDVKFYPYSAPYCDPVFATTSSRGDTVVYRCTNDGDQVLQILRLFHDKAEGDFKKLNSLIWSRHPDTAHPLICVAGEDSRIKVLDVVTGTLIQTLVGHGGMINDLVVSPKSPTILASASMDRSIRLWDLDPRQEEYPCSVIYGGDAHTEGVLSLDIHRKGRYLISGGHDTRVNLWVIPENIEEPPNLPDATSSRTRTKKVNFPHFSSVEVHSDYVDCIKFYNDLVISKAADEDRILLWKIDGFSTTNDEVQPESIAPIVTCTDSSTKSAFGGKFQRLLIFDAIGSSTNWMRFGLFHEPGKHPILALGQDTYAITTHKMDWSILFWDLALLEEGLSDQSDDKVTEHLSQDPLRPFPPHKKVKLPRLEKSPRSFCIRSIAWSPGGEWCVAVDESCYIHVLSR